jgi:hypothetical protein
MPGFRWWIAAIVLQAIHIVNRRTQRFVTVKVIDAYDVDSSVRQRTRDRRESHRDASVDACTLSSASCSLN